VPGRVLVLVLAQVLAPGPALAQVLAWARRRPQLRWPAVPKS